MSTEELCQARHYRFGPCIRAPHPETQAHEARVGGGQIMQWYGDKSARRIYDGRPDADTLAARMRRDKVSGDVRYIVTSDTYIGSDGAYERVQVGVFQGDNMVAAYRTLARGKIAGGVRGKHTQYLIPAPGHWRPATPDDIARAEQGQ